MSESTTSVQWIGYWKFHFPTSDEYDALRIFQRVAERVRFRPTTTAAGVRGARPGTWVTAEENYGEGLGDGLIAVLEDAGKFANRLDVTPPQRYEDGLVVISGWISRCRHSELEAVEFELRNQPI